MASPTLTDRLKSFANKISGTSVIDNNANPASALNMLRRKAQSQGPVKKPIVGTNSNGTGVGP